MKQLFLASLMLFPAITFQPVSHLKPTDPRPVVQAVTAALALKATPQFPDRSAAAAAYLAAQTSCEAQGGSFSQDACVMPPPPPPPPTPVYTHTPTFINSSGNDYTPGQCTWAVKNWKPEVPNGLGNAANWGYALGYDANPVVGAVAWTTAGYAGHVAVVTAVAAGQVEIQEMNALSGPYGVDDQWVPASQFLYIHI